MYVHLLRGNRDLFVAALGGSSRAASGRPEAVADDERGKEVRLADSTCEAGEQSGTSRGGAGGGKQWDLWRRTLRRRSQKDRMTWERMTQLVDAWLPKPIILHPWPSDRFAVTNPRWEPYAGKPPVRFCAGGAR